MQRKIVVFDFETDGVNPNACNPIQLAAVVIDNFDLNIIPDSSFAIDIQPPQFATNREAYLANENVQKTLRWHCDKKKCSLEDMYKLLENGTDEKRAWGLFIAWMKQYNPGGKEFFNPVAGGANIRNFDLIIARKLCEEHGTKFPFWKRDVADILDLSYLWLSHVNGAPNKYNMDVLRKYHGMDDSQAHDAIFDVQQEAELISKYLKLHRRFANSVRFENSFQQKEVAQA